MNDRSGWSLDMSAGPIFEQIGHNVRRMIARGGLRPGDRLPSARDLAERLGVNPNTVVHAYQQLERTGTIETRRGKGSYVCEDAAVAAMRTEMLAAAATAFANESRRLGVTREEALHTLKEVWDAGNA
ncbi:MAG: GntR family transcriptional regulator [Candidatus Bipolaricaulota bacterium]|nr:MAG: GntR family transcriptional regulator [Candidatus Bipolaricaulota bacterium]